jgi:hypothetical protein
MKGLRMRQPVALGHANRLVNHGPTVLVSSAHNGRWAMHEGNIALHHLGGGHFGVIGDVVQGQVKTG